MGHKGRILNSTKLLFVVTLVLVTAASDILAGPLLRGSGSSSRDSRNSGTSSSEKVDRSSQTRDSERANRPSSPTRDSERVNRPSSSTRDSERVNRSSGTSTHATPRSNSGTSSGSVIGSGKSGRNTSPADRNSTLSRQPSERVNKPSVRYAPDDSNNRTYRPESNNRQGKVFERANERDVSRHRDRDRNDYRHRPEYKKYYRGSYYRPYQGWQKPHYQSGYYYYSWPYQIEPCRYGYYVWNYDSSYAYPSVYFHYGHYPYIYRSRVAVIDRPAVNYIERRLDRSYYSGDDYYLDKPAAAGIGRVLYDIKQAWLANEPGLMERHIRSYGNIAIYLDGSYSYSIDSRDYREITRDAMDRVHTLSFNFEEVRERGNDRIAAYGIHRYLDVDDDTTKTVYVKYVLEKYGADWYIIETGSSNRPLY